MKSKIRSKTPLVSVVMSVYNGEKYLREAIDSILNQTFTDFEFIIINDGSTDNTLKIIKSYKDPRIVLISRENKGQALARNAGIALARGKYIAMMDADDISLPERFEKQVDYLEGHHDIGAVSSFVQNVDSSGKPIGAWEDDVNVKTPEQIRNTIAYKNCFSHAPTIFRAKNIKHYQYRNIKAAEDYELWLRMISDGIKLAKIPEFLYLYRQHDSSTMAVAQVIDFDWRMAKMKLNFLWYRLGQFKLSMFDFRVFGAVIAHIYYWLPREAKKIIKRILFISSINNDRDKKTILLISTAKSIGGGEIYVQQIIRHLHLKYNFILLAPRQLHDKFGDGLTYRRINLPDWVYSLGLRGSYMVQSLWLRSLRLKHVDLVHMQQLDDVLTRFFNGTAPIIFTAHSRLQLKGIQLNFTKKIAMRLNATIAVAKVLNPDLKKLGLTSDRIINIPNGVDGEGLTKLKANRVCNEIIWVGRLEKNDKNPDLFLEIAKKMPQESFCMYGDGGYRDELLSIIKERNINNVYIKGFVDDTKEIYRKAKLLCLTSESEAMPLVVLEALAAGVPVVSTKVGDVEAVLSSGGGVCVSKSRADSFAKEISRILERREKYAESARENYLKNYQIQKMIAGLDKFYGKMVR
ncbi:glycosyltransferase [bacterium]|nr:MAG: glycosyltransferase [bacterium]